MPIRMDSGTSSTLPLPPEITDQIITLVREDDRKTLYNCALVCRNSLAASRHRLFRRIDLRYFSIRRYNLLVSRVLRDRNLEYCLAAVQHIVLSGHRVATKARPAGIIHLFLSDFAYHLPHLHTLAIEGCDWIQTSPPHPRIFAAASASFPSLTRLSFHSVDFPSFSFFRRVVGTIPALTDLRRSRIGWPCASVEWLAEQRFARCRTSLRVLNLLAPPGNPQGLILAGLFAWLSQTPSVDSLCNLTLNLDLPEQVLEDGFLRHLAPRIEKLNMRDQPLPSGNVPISYFTKLTDVHLVLDREDPEAQRARMVSYINGSKSPRLCRLTFIIILTEQDSGTDYKPRDHAAHQRERDEWRTHLTLVDNLLAGDRFKALEEFRLCVRPRWYGFQAPPMPLDRGLPLEDLRRLLPKLYSKGVKMFVSPHCRLD